MTTPLHDHYSNRAGTPARVGPPAQVPGIHARAGILHPHVPHTVVIITAQVAIPVLTPGSTVVDIDRGNFRPSCGNFRQVPGTDRR